MKCPSCGFEYYQEETLKKGICPACGASLVAPVDERVRRQVEVRSVEARLPTMAEMGEINRKLDSIMSGVTFLVVVTIIGILLGGLALYIILATVG